MKLPGSGIALAYNRYSGGKVFFRYRTYGMAQAIQWHSYGSNIHKQDRLVLIR